MKILRDLFGSPVDDPQEANLRHRILWLFVLDVGLLLALIWLNLLGKDLGYRIDSTTRLIEKLDLEYAELTSEYARETSPERLRMRAERELGMRLPVPGQVTSFDGEP